MSFKNSCLFYILSNHNDMNNVLQIIQEYQKQKKIPASGIEYEFIQFAEVLCKIGYLCTMGNVYKLNIAYTFTLTLYRKIHPKYFTKRNEVSRCALLIESSKESNIDGFETLIFIFQICSHSISNLRLIILSIILYFNTFQN